MAYTTQELEQQAKFPNYRHTFRKNDCGASIASVRGKVLNAFVQTGQWLGFGKRVKVYDLVNCGPRNQFVVFGSDGPVIVHNCTQALCRDLLANALVTVENAGWPIILHVHDEIVTEVPNTPDYTVAELGRMMCDRPDWAAGFPLAAEGAELMRYAK